MITIKAKVKGLTFRKISKNFYAKIIVLLHSTKINAGLASLPLCFWHNFSLPRSFCAQTFAINFFALGTKTAGQLCDFITKHRKQGQFFWGYLSSKFENRHTTFVGSKATTKIATSEATFMFIIKVFKGQKF